MQNIQYLQVVFNIRQQLIHFVLDKISVTSEQVIKSLVLVHILYFFQLYLNIQHEQENGRHEI